VYSGTSASGTLMATLSGSSLPSAITVSNSAMYITWTTDSSVVAAGWSANYVATTSGLLLRPSVLFDPLAHLFRSTGLCNGLATYSAPTGNLASGPTGQQYSNNMACQFLIQPLGAESISIYFSSFTPESSLDLVRLVLRI
jgi:hypothetical protein